MLEIVLLAHLAKPQSIVFTSGSTEAASLALNAHKIRCSEIEHDAVKSLCETTLTTFPSGQVLLMILQRLLFNWLIRRPALFKICPVIFF